MRAALFIAAAAWFAAEAGAAVDPRAKSVSATKQFTVFCEDGALRARVASFVDEVKRGVLDVVGERDGWRIPVVVSLEPAPAGTDPGTPVTLRLIQTPNGPSIQLHVQIGSNPADVHLQKHIVRAVLLDLIYRDRPPRAGDPYVEAPWWFVAGTVERFRQRDHGFEAGLYRRMIETNRLPSVGEFLPGHGHDLGGVAAAFDSACAFALLQLLLEQPEGKPRLAQLLRNWPETHLDPVAALTHAFPALGPDAESLQKWWTLNFARFATSDRYRGLGAEDTDRALEELLAFEVVVNKSGKKERFAVHDFKEFMRHRGARAAAAAQQKAIITLSTKANVLMRPVLASYEEVFALLARGKTRGIADRIERAELYRSAVLQRKTDIADYLNWYEATQFGTRSGAFENFLRAARTAAATPSQTQTTKAISSYLDLLENEL